MRDTCCLRGDADPGERSRCAVTARRKHAAFATAGHRSPGKKPGGYYLDDGPGANPPADLEAIPDAVPRREPIKASTARPYTALGRTYTPKSELVPYKARGLASLVRQALPRPAHFERRGLRHVRHDRGAHDAADPELRARDRRCATDDRWSCASTTAGRSTPIASSICPTSPRGSSASSSDGSGMVEVEVHHSRRRGGFGAWRRKAVAVPAQVPAAAAAAGQPGSSCSSAPSAAATTPRISSRKMRVELDDLGVRQEILARDGLYRVQAGPYVDRASAASDATRINDRLGVKPVIVVR